MTYLVASLFALLGAACVVLVVFQLPGTWVMLGLALLVEWADRFYLPEPERQTFGWWVLGGAALLFGIGELIEFLASAVGAKKGGASRRGMIGALIGGIAGALLLAVPLAFIPVLGVLVGALIGTFAGAVVGEVTAAAPKTVRQSLKPALGAAIGRAVATATKVGVAVAGWITLTVAAFW